MSVYIDGESTVLRFITANKASVRQVHVFLRNSGNLLKFSVHTAQVMQMMPKHIFWPIIDSSSLYATGITRGQGAVLVFYAESVGVVISGHVTKMAVKSFDPAWPKTPCSSQTARLYHL